MNATKYAKKYVEDVEFYCEDAGRSDYEFLAKVVEAVIAAGATVVNIPDTTGYSLPEEYGRRIKFLMENVKNIDKASFRFTATTTSAWPLRFLLRALRTAQRRSSVRQRSGRTRPQHRPWKKWIMAIKMHGEELDAHTDINTREFIRASRLVSSITGFVVQPNKSIVGANAFAHSSGIHQDGVIKERTTYEIIDPTEVGAGQSSIVLSARSGRAALRHRLEALGYHIEGQEFEDLHTAFLDLADKKKEVYDEDLESLVGEQGRTQEASYTLKSVQISCGQPLTPTATVTLVDKNDNEFCACSIGTGPVDALYRAVNEIVDIENDLSEFSVQSVTRGIDALGEVTIRVTAADGTVYTGRGSDGDIIVSSAKAYLNALNRLIADKQ